MKLFSIFNALDTDNTAPRDPSCTNDIIIWILNPFGNLRFDQIRNPYPVVFQGRKMIILEIWLRLYIWKKNKVPFPFRKIFQTESLKLNCLSQWVPTPTPVKDAGGQGHRNSGQLCLVVVRPDRRLFFEKSGQNREGHSPDSSQYGFNSQGTEIFPFSYFTNPWLECDLVIKDIKNIIHFYETRTYVLNFG